MLSAQFYEIMVAAGLAKARKNKQAAKKGRDARRENNPLTFHSIRHSATSILMNAGVSPAVVQEFIGHDDKAVCQNYAPIEIEAMRRATDRMPDVSVEEAAEPPRGYKSDSGTAEVVELEELAEPEASNVRAEGGSFVCSRLVPESISR